LKLGIRPSCKSIAYSFISLALLGLIYYYVSSTPSSRDRETPDWSTKAKHSKQRPSTQHDIQHSSQTERLHQVPSPPFPSSSPNSGSKQSAFVVYNLQNYLQEPPAKASKTSTPKSEQSIQKIISTLQETNPSILGVCEIGTHSDLSDLQLRLKNAQIDLPYSYLAPSDDPLRHLALLSAFPLTPHPYTSPTYTIRGVELTIRRGILDVTVHLPGQPVRLLGVHLKSKRPSYFDHNKIRRYEAHLLRQHIDSIQTTSPETALIVYGDFNDSKQSPSLKTVQGQHTSRIKPITLEAADGSRWTHYWKHEDSYTRIDYIMHNKQAKHLCVTPKPSLFLLSIKGSGSDHRALKILLKHH